VNDTLISVLDLGTAKVAALLAEATDEGGIVVRGAVSVQCRGLARGVPTSLEETTIAIDAAVRRLRQATGAPVEKVIVSLNGSHLESENKQGFVPIYPKTRPIGREDVLHVVNHSRQVVPAPDREQVLALPREFRVDGQRGVTKPIGMCGGRLEVVTHIVTGQTAHLQNVEKAVSMAGLGVIQTIPAPIAAGYGVADANAMNGGCVVVDLGAGTTGIAIFNGGAIAGTVVLPIGAGTVTSDIAKLLRTSPEEAERVKLAFGCATAEGLVEDEGVEVHQIGQPQPRYLPRKVLCEIIESRMREIAQLVRAQIDRSGLMGQLAGGVILTGGGSLLPGTVDIFRQELRGAGVRLAVPCTEGPASVAANRAEMATAVGLAAYVLGAEEDELEPASGIEHLKVKLRSLKAIFGPRG